STCIHTFLSVFFFFFQAEDGIRDFHVTGVQTCALPIFNVSGYAIGDCRELVAGLQDTRTASGNTGRRELGECKSISTEVSNTSWCAKYPTGVGQGGAFFNEREHAAADFVACATIQVGVVGVVCTYQSEGRTSDRYAVDTVLRSIGLVLQQ